MKNMIQNSMLNVIRFFHNKLVFGRRVAVLAEHVGSLLPDGASVLDIGCGSGLLSARIMQKRGNIAIRGVEVLPRKGCLIENIAFDGHTIPFASNTHDVCMLIDVLHHGKDMFQLLDEAHRVSKRYVLIKDHLCEGRRDRIILTFMDWMGNKPHGVSLGVRYLSRGEWLALFDERGWTVSAWDEYLPLYPQPAQRLFGRGLHFVALLKVR